VRVDQILDWEEAADPDQVSPLGANLLRQLLHLGADLGCVRRAGHDDQLKAGVNFERGGKEKVGTKSP
jgi:hypothetical protein